MVAFSWPLFSAMFKSGIFFVHAFFGTSKRDLWGKEERDSCVAYW